MIGPGAPCGSDIPSILELQLRKSVELTAKVPVEDPDQDEYADALKRVKKLLADTREMVVRAENLVASLRAPKDCYKTNGR